MYIYVTYGQKQLLVAEQREKSSRGSYTVSAGSCIVGRYDRINSSVYSDFLDSDGDAEEWTDSECKM